MHPALCLTGSIVALLNIRSWNLHLPHFISDHVHLNHCDIFCFTETHLKQKPTHDVSDFSENWASVFKHTEHGLALTYNAEHVELVKEFKMTENIEIMACHLRCDSLVLCDFILVIVYRKPGSSIVNFLSILHDEIQNLPSGYRTIIVGDFNLDQRLKENADTMNLFARNISFSQKSTNFSTHNERGILDLVFDSCNLHNVVQWQPTPFSDHFVLYFKL